MDTELVVVGDRRKNSGVQIGKVFTPQIILTLATMVFAAGVLWQKVEATEKRLDRIEAIVIPDRLHADAAGRPAASIDSAATAAVPGSDPVGLFVNVRNFIGGNHVP